MTKQQEPPKIEFPCDNYPIKAVGVNMGNLREHVIEIIHIHVDDFDETTVTLQDSSKGSFQSVRFKITATGVDQLKSLHEALMASEHIKMVI